MNRRRRRHYRSKVALRSLYKRLSFLFLSGSEDEDEELIGILFLLKARQLGSATGFRGPYNRVKSVDLCQKLLYLYSERWFKAHLRQVCMSFC